MKKLSWSILALIAAAILTITAVGCNKEEEGAGSDTETAMEVKDTGKTYEIKFAHPFSPMHTLQRLVFEPWGEELAEMSDGRLKVTFFPGGALGKTPDHFDIVKDGLADATYNLHDYTPGRFPLTSVFELPFMVGDAEPSSAAMWDVYEKFPEFQKEYAEVKPLALFCHSGGNFMMVTKPVTKLSDLNGLKIRTANPFVTDALKIFGAAPVNMPITDTYTSLSRGVVDGTVSPNEPLKVFKFEEVIKYSTPVSFYTMTMYVVMNKDKYESLPPDLKKIIDDTTGRDFSILHGKSLDSVEAPIKESAIENFGLEVTPLEPGERDKLIEMTMPMREEWVEEMAAKGAPAQDILDSAIKFTADYQK